MTPIQRFTLSLENSASANTSNYIKQEQYLGLSRSHGPASAGYILSRMGTAVLVSSSAGFDYGALSELDGNDVQTITDPKTLTKFIGQVGASFILASLQYNPWVALHSEPIAVTSPQLAICYHGPYFWGFLPLVAAAVIVIGWALVILFKVHYESLGNMGRLYGGLYPYWGVVRPEAALDDVVLVWEKNPDSDSERPPLMRLEVVSEDIPSAETTGSTAVDYLASTLQHKPTAINEDQVRDSEL